MATSRIKIFNYYYCYFKICSNDRVVIWKHYLGDRTTTRTIGAIVNTTTFAIHTTDMKERKLVRSGFVCESRAKSLLSDPGIVGIRNFANG